MKTLKIKLWLLSLMAMLTISLFFVSCEQGSIVSSMEEELAIDIDHRNGQEIEYEQLSEQEQADFARFLGWLWGDGRPNNANNKTGSKFTGSHPKYNKVFNRLKNITIDDTANPFNLPESGDNKKLPDFWDYWENPLPGGNPDDPQILRDALKNPNFLAGLIDGEGQQNHTVGSTYYIDDQTYAPSHPGDNKTYSMLNFGPERMIQLFVLLGESYGFEHTKMKVGNTVYDYSDRDTAIAALNAKYNRAKAINEDPNTEEADLITFNIEVYVDENYFDDLRSYGYWEQDIGFRTPASNNSPLDILTGDYPNILDEVGTAVPRYLQIQHKDSGKFLSTGLELESSANDNTLTWSTLDIDGEYFRIVSKENGKWLKALQDGKLMLASVSNTGHQTQWKKKELSNGYFLLINRRFETHLRVNNGSNIRHGSSGSTAHWSLPDTN